MGTLETVIASLAATLPDAGDFEIVTTCAILFAFLRWVASTVSGNEPEDAEHHAFRAGMIGTAIGAVIYLIGLVTGVY